MKTLRLKSLELNGYKTFASAQKFEFGAPITAVVGPNGSGKSNIADSLRWVLGEQSYALLRGRKTEDMIFAGSESRAKSGMASVTLTFDNSEGWLPVDFAEVAVTRRAYRDGQNEYLINNQKVRLRDVSELLAASGLSERTYTVIGQGLVDAALTLKSDERRRLFEEAAGIGLYRDRKDQSLRRLETTMRNLERVEDILAELKPRLRSLQRQAERAEEFATLRADLRNTLREWYGYHWNKSQTEIRQLHQDADLHEQNLAQARQKQSQHNQEVTKLRTRTQELRVQLNEWHRKLAELHAGRQGASRDLAVADERERALGERRTALEEERQRVESELAGLKARLQEAEQDSTRYEEESAEAQKKLDEARAELLAKQGAQHEKEARTRAARERVVELQAQQANSRAQREMLVSSLERKKAELAELAGTISNVQGDIAEQTQATEKLKAKVAEAEQRHAEQRQLVDQASTEVARLQEQHKQRETSRAQLQTRQARLAAEISGLEEANAAGYAEGAKLILQAAKGKATLGRELRVATQYEAAIAAALGAYADGVIVDDPEAAMGLLEGGDASAALLPLSGLHAAGRLSAQAGNGLVGVAADLVDVASELRPAVDLLLGRVLVAESRQAARRLLAEHAEATQVVTLRGEVFHRAGTIEVRAAKSAAALARPRQERELRAELEQVGGQLAELENELATLADRADQGELARQAAVRELETAQAAVDNARREVQGQEMEAGQLQRQLDWFMTQQRTLQGEQATGEETITRLTTKDVDISTQMAAAEAEFETEMAIAVEEPAEELHAQVAHWEMRLAVGQRAQQEAQRRVAERQQLLQRAESQLSSHHERVQELEAQVEAIRSERQQLSQQEGQVGSEIDGLQVQIEPTETELAAADAALTEAQGNETSSLQSLSAAERNHTQAQISLARHQESLETLRGRIEDDFGLVNFQYDEIVSGPTPLPLGELVEKLPTVEMLSPELEDILKQQRNQIRRLGAVNPEAQKEYVEIKERVESMEAQVIDLRTAETDLKQVIAELDVMMEKEFQVTFERVAAEFKLIFSRLFNGGSASLLLTEGGEGGQTGIDIEARLPGKRTQRLALLSGGERSLTAAALVFALLKASPTPFCVMDEVDAMLDEANVGRFTEVLRELSQETQFVVITHNRNTVQAADVIYGITMGRDTASQVISLRLDEVDERYSR
ncbi:MAG TPA: chromosome segregation protein SMC [Anaerolineales bacterium]|nr:chromosome segregation protein SMC [Anaerolineales bacterium]HRQ93037.1 chromosome segregation protein SMC [Anaerolineales bacterium]